MHGIFSYMDTYIPEFFFNLKDFSHQSLFLKDQPIWETLKHLKNYLNSLKLGKIEINIPQGVTLVHPEKISIGKDVVLEPGCFIEGPCSLGRGVHVRHGAYIRPNVIIGDYSIVGHASELKHAILMNHSAAPHFNYVGDSIIGNHVNLGAGVICANFRLDKKKIFVSVAGEKIETHLLKFGAVIGDNSQLGCHTVINPGTLLRKKTLSPPSTVIKDSNVKKGIFCEKS